MTDRIDTHVHVYRFGDGRGGQAVPASPVSVPGGSAPLEWLLTDMDEHAINACVLVQHSAFGTDNAYICDCRRRLPDRLRAIGLLDPTAPDAPDALGRWMARGLSGFRFHLFYGHGAGWLATSQADRLFGAAAELGAILQFHLRPEQAQGLEAVLRHHRDVVVLLDHLAKPDVTETAPFPSYQPVLRLSAYDNCYVKLGDYEKASREGYPWRDTWPFVELLRASFGAERMVFGTGFPGAHRRVPLGEALAYVERELPLSPGERRAILSDTPRRLFGFEERPPPLP